MMNKAEIKNGIVTNMILVDPNNIPDFCASWPEVVEGCQIGGSYVGGVFIPLPEPEPEPVTLEQQKAARAKAYTSEADPLFFKTQRNEATEAEWLAKVAEIKARFPYPSEV
jgi:hypothetical protein